MVDLNHIDNWIQRTKDEVSQKEYKIDQLRSKVDNDVIDSLAKSATEQAYKSIDCLDCGNCCRTSVTDFTLQDINRASKYLGVSKKSFIKNYLIEDLDGKYITISSPCPFLNLENNKCNIYDARPFVCDSYPHTDRTNFNNRYKAHKRNLDMCPITYFVVERMWEEIDKRGEV